MYQSRFKTDENDDVLFFKTNDYSVQFDVQEKDIDFHTLTKILDTVETASAQARHYFGLNRTHAKCITLGCPVQMSRKFLPDATDLSEKDFSELLATITDLQELEGFANRRSLFNVPQLPPYKPWQRELILQRKWELSHG